jgi:hypothetical protein
MFFLGGDFTVYNAKGREERLARMMRAETYDKFNSGR